MACPRNGAPGHWALGILGLFNIVGSLAMGWAVGRWRVKSLLSLVYAVRAVAVLVFVLAPKTGPVVLVFAAVTGVSFLSTVPPTGMNDALESFVPMTLAKRGVQQLATTDAPAFDTTLLQGLGRAFYWKHLLVSGIANSGSDIARQEGLHHSCINELMRLTLLAPDIVAQLMAGRQPRRLTLMWFQRNPLPLDWQAQRDIIANFE